MASAPVSEPVSVSAWGLVSALESVPVSAWGLVSALGSASVSASALESVWAQASEWGLASDSDCWASLTNCSLRLQPRRRRPGFDRRATSASSCCPSSMLRAFAGQPQRTPANLFVFYVTSKTLVASSRIVRAE